MINPKLRLTSCHALFSSRVGQNVRRPARSGVGGYKGSGFQLGFPKYLL